jgi:hypothetical protein
MDEGVAPHINSRRDEAVCLAVDPSTSHTAHDADDEIA